MSIRTRPKRRRGSIAARLLAAGALVASLAGSVVLAGPAAADTNCPTFQAVGFTWSSEFDDGGVTLCHGTDVDAHDAILEIIDLSAGAKIRVASEIEPDSVATAPQDDTKFLMRGAEDWRNWIRDGGITSPDGNQLFSVMNAGFFINDGLFDTITPLSLPEMVDFSLRTQGYARRDLGGGTHDAAWDIDKRRLLLSTPYPNVAPPAPQNQYAAMCSFPTHYGALDPIFMNFCDSLQYKDVIVGFQPLAGVNGNPEPPQATQRTMVGWDGQGKIFTVEFPSATLQETQAFLQSLGSTMEVQLDGGCSAQFYAGIRPAVGFTGRTWAGDHTPGVCPRMVPEVLAVYTSTGLL